MTDGAGTYCTAQQEENASYEALKRDCALGLLDIERLAVLRTGADFDRPYLGQTSWQGLVDYAEQGGFVPSVNNLYHAGSLLITDIVAHWPEWPTGEP